MYTAAAMPLKRKPSPAVSLHRLKPLLKPVVEPVLERLARTEKLLEEMKTALEVQFKRTAAIQAQLDQIVARLPRRRR